MFNNVPFRRRVLIVDDDKFMREGLTILLSIFPEFECVGEARNGLEASYYTAKYRPDVVLMDMDMPQMNGVKATEFINCFYPDIRIIALSDNEYADEFVCQALSCGAKTWVSKSASIDTFADAIRAER